MSERAPAARRGVAGRLRGGWTGWLPLLLYAALCAVAFPLVPTVAALLRASSVGRHVLDWGAAYAFTAILLWWGARAGSGGRWWNGRSGGGRHWRRLALVGTLAGGLMLGVADGPVDRLHLPQYALLVLLLAAVLASPWHALGIAGIVGIGDELAQRMIPGRVFDWWDVLLNALGALLGMAVLLAAAPPAAGRAEARRPAD